MDNKTSLNTHEIDFLIASGRQFIGRMLGQVESGKINARDFTDYLKTLDKTFVNLGAERKDVIENEKLAHLYKVSRLIGASLDQQTVLEQVMDAVIQLTGAERGFLMLLEEGNLAMRVARNFDRVTLDSEEFKVSSTITSRVMQTGQAIVTTNAMEDPRFRSKTSVIADKLSSIMASPLLVHGQIIGVIYVDNRARTGLFF